MNMNKILGTLGLPVDCEDGLPPDAPRGKVAERILAAELLEVLRNIERTMTETFEKFRKGVINHTLEVGTRTLPTSGCYSRTFTIPAGSIEVRNLGADDMTVISASAGSSAPVDGIGVYVVPAGSSALINLASHDLTIWGTAGDRFSYQVFTRGGDASPSLNAVDGGGA
jgi:hypothetical protein